MPELGEAADALAALRAAKAAEQAAYEARMRAERALARTLGMRDDGKDFAFEAEQAAEQFIIGQVIAQRQRPDRG